MRVDAWVKPFVAITYKANNAQAIIPFGITVKYGFIAIKPVNRPCGVKKGRFASAFSGIMIFSVSNKEIAAKKKLTKYRFR